MYSHQTSSIGYATVAKWIYFSYKLCAVYNLKVLILCLLVYFISHLFDTNCNLVPLDEIWWNVQ